MTESLPSLDQTSALLRHRRSVKPVDMDPDRALPTDLVWQLLESATWAPTHGLTEPWRFVVYTGTARAAFARTLQDIYQRATPAPEYREDKFRKLGENPLLAAVTILCVMERCGGDKIPEHEELQAVACAVQNLLLGATAAGVASFWSSPPLIGTREFKAAFQLGPGDRCLGFVYLGWPKASLTWPRSTRQPVQTKVIWHDV